MINLNQGEYCKRINGLTSLIGNTPILAIEYKIKGQKRTIYTKAEHLNMTGSIKDRMAFHIIEQAYKRGSLKPGNMLIEATSGNTGIAFSAIGKALGHPVTIFMPDWMSGERINLIGSLGAKIVLVSKDEGGFLGSISMAEELAQKTEGAFLPSQFSNQDNCNAHCETTGPEIWWQLRYRSLIPDAFIAGVGTGGTIMGTGEFLKTKNINIKLHPLEPSNSPTLSTGCKVGKHRIQGISDEFIPSILNLDKLDEIVCVDDGDAIIMAQKIASELGLGVGISSGANFLGAVDIQDKMGGDAVVVTVFPDDSKKYLSTDLLREESVKESFISPHIELLNVYAFKRVCHTCCDPENCIEASFKEKIEEQFPRCSKRGI